MMCIGYSSEKSVKYLISKHHLKLYTLFSSQALGYQGSSKSMRKGMLAQLFESPNYHTEY